MEVDEVKKSAQKQFTSFLSGKPMWAYWIAYSVLSAVLFGIFYTVMYLMAWQWWIPVIIIIAVGIIWGTVAYPRNAHTIINEPVEK